MPKLRKSVQLKVDALPADLVGRNPHKVQPKEQLFSMGEQDQKIIFAAAQRHNWEAITRIYDALALERELSEMPCEHRVNLATRLQSVLTVSKTKRRGIFVADVTPEIKEKEKAASQRGRKLRKYSNRVQEKGVETSATGRTALHVAAQAHAPLAVVEALMKLQPSAVRSRDNASSTPLHLAAGGGFAFARAKSTAVQHAHAKPVDAEKRGRTVLGAVLDAAPDLAAAVDEDGHTPLDIAVRVKKWALIERLVDANPRAVKRSDSQEYPLYARALRERAPPRVLRLLEDAHPRSAMPLPSLIKCKFFDDAVRLVLDDGEYAKVKDDRGRLPLHLCADDADAPDALIHALLEAHPQGANCRDAADQLPLTHSCASGVASALYREVPEPAAYLISQ